MLMILSTTGYLYSLNASTLSKEWNFVSFYLLFYWTSLSSLVLDHISASVKTCYFIKQLIAFEQISVL